MKAILLTIDRVAGWLLLIGALLHGYAQSANRFGISDALTTLWPKPDPSKSDYVCFCTKRTFRR